MVPPRACVSNYHEGLRGTRAGEYYALFNNIQYYWKLKNGHE